MTQTGNYHPELEWDLIRAFLAVVDTGSITAAAAALSTSQPTVSRHISSLEQRLGSALFERVGRGLNLTGAGKALVEPARRMQAAANAFSLTALSYSQEIAGTVRISASEMTATYILPALLTDLRLKHPEIQIELTVTNRIENLLEHEADIAIRHVRPEQENLIARRLGSFQMGAFVHYDYLKHVGGEIDMAHRHRYDWLGLDRSDLYLRGFHRVGIEIDRQFFAVRCDDQVTLWQMVLAGMGVGFGPLYLGKKHPELRQVLTEMEIPSLPVWVTSHSELRSSARIRSVYDILADGLKHLVDEE